MEETSGLWQNGVDVERPREPEAREADAGDSVFTAAEINSHRRGSGDKYKPSSYGYQVKGSRSWHELAITATNFIEIVRKC